MWSTMSAPVPSTTAPFALNDEVNRAALDRTLAATLDADFADDLAQSRPLTLEMLVKRTLLSG